MTPTSQNAPFRRLLVPTDGSDIALEAADKAIALALATGAELIAVHVVPRYPVSYFEGAVLHTPEETERIEGRWVEHGRKLAEAMRSKAEKAGVKAKAIIARADIVSEAVLAAARQHECDLIVMASHGRKGIQRLLLGSETLHVLTHGHVPVLVVRG